MTPEKPPPFQYLQPTHDLHDTDAMARAMHDDGFALIPGVLDADDVAQARSQIDRLEPFGFDVVGDVLDHYKCVFNRDSFWLKFIDWPGIVDLAEATMGDDCHIIGQTAWRSRPGHNGWGPHVDRLFAPMPEDMASDPRFTLPIFLCTAHFYLNDITIDLCPTYVVRGSHKSGRGPDNTSHELEWRGNKIEPVLCKAGNVLFFRSEIWHSGSQNVSDDTRYLLQVHYSQRVVAQQFSPYITWQFNQNVLAAASPRQLRLLGNHKQGPYD